MPTYLNGYTLLEKVRIQLNEYSTAYVQGTDTTGKYQNAQIMDGINASNRFLYSWLLPKIPYEFKEETTITGVNSVYTLPADFGVLKLFKDSDGYQIYNIKERERRTTARDGSDQHYYRKGNTLVLDKSGVVETNTLIYQRKCREIEQGKASAGAATSITLATTAKKIVDYYNGLTIENITQDWVDTIDDYTAARVATISETAAANDYYGTVSDIPEPFHHLIIPRAVFEVTGNFPIVKEKPNKTGMKIFIEDLYETLNAYAGPSQDEYVEDIYAGHTFGQGFPGYIIPGHE